MPQRMPGSREEDAWLSDEQLARCTPADEAEGFDSPIPTQMVSNGEYMPYPQTDKQKQVEARIKELADSASKKLGISRRKFLAGTGGMAAALLAMNEVFGRFFDVKPIDMFDSEAFAASGPPPNLFVLDDQTHMVRFTQTQGRSLRAIAQGPGPASTAAGFLRNPNNPTGALDELGNAWTPWNPLLGQTPNTGSEFHLAKYVQRFFLESQVTVSILSNANLGSIPVAGEPNRPPKNIAESLGAENLTGHMTAGVRDFVNQIAGSTRMLAHGQLYPGVGNLHDPVYGDYTQWQIDTFHPDSWKGYNIATAAKLDFNPDSVMARWRLDDELVAYPIYEVIARNRQELRKHPGFWNICVHKGLAPGPPDVPERGNPTDIPKAAGDWPQFNFIIYHSCIRNGFFDLDSLETIRSGPTRVVQGAEVPDISWTTQFAELSAPFRNVYAELGTTFAGSVVTFPTVWAHIIGQLLKFMGPDRIVFGSDSLWYGGPQWQIDAFWRFQIPEEIQERWGYPALTEASRRKILGLNSARLYKLPGASEASDHGKYKPVPENFQSQIPNSLLTLLEYQGVANDTFSKMRKQYVEMGGKRSNTRYGWIRTKA
jgi:predicted TIM-barrel fold metal-dependent hydrolase